MDYKEKEFEKMVHTQKEVIYTVCYMFSKNEDEVADLFQETLINMWKGIINNNANMLEAERDAQKAWVYRVTLNTCISWDRKKKKHPTVSLTMDVNLFSDTDSRTRQVDMLHERISSMEH